MVLRASGLLRGQGLRDKIAESESEGVCAHRGWMAQGARLDGDDSESLGVQEAGRP
jgi:hypothetical protein